MERLTEWIGDREKAIPKMDIRHNGYDRCIRKLAELEDLDDQGLLLRLPCKIDEDTLAYKIYQFMGEGAWEIDVHHIQFSDLREINKTVFMTREAAENALKKIEDGTLDYPFSVKPAAGKSLRLIRKTTVEYEPDRKYYPKHSTLSDIARLDALSDAADLVVFGGEVGTTTENITYEILDEDKNIVERGTVED